MDSVSSDKTDIQPLAHYPRRQFPLFTAVVAGALLAIAVWVRLWHEDGSGYRLTSLSQNFDAITHRLMSYLSPLQKPNTVTLSPALETAIQNLVVETINTHYIAVHKPQEFARKVNGGRIIPSLTSGYHGILERVFQSANSPSIVIDDELYSEICWVVPTLPAQVGIRTSHLIRPLQVSVEGFAELPAADMTQAPKHMRLWGIVDGRVNKEIFATLTSPQLSNRGPSFQPAIANDLTWAPLASFVYDSSTRAHTQAFPISHVFVDSGLSFGIFVLEVLDNWGAASTCVCKLRIYGTAV